VKSVFFDWDGTLVDSLPLLFAAHNHVRRYMGHAPWSREEYMQAIVYSSRELYPRLYGDRSEEARAVLADYIHAHHLQALKVMDGAEDLLETLLARNVPMGVVSNKTHEFLQREIAHLGWEKYFPVRNGAGIAPKDKPSGAPLLHALAMHPAKPLLEGVIYVGDMESDLGCGLEAGCPVAFIRTDPRSDALIEQYKPAYVVTDMAGLKTALMEFLG